MKFLLLTLILVNATMNMAQAGSAQRFKGTNTQYNTWTKPDVYSCYAALVTTGSGYELTLTYDRKDLKFLNGQKFIFDKKDITHPATDQAYSEVPVNFKKDTYFAYSHLKGVGYVRISLKKVGLELQVEPGWGFQFRQDQFREPIYDCVSLRKLNSY